MTRQCETPAAYAIATDITTVNACAWHALQIIDSMTDEPGQTVTVSQVQADRPCDHVKENRWNLW